MALSAIGWGLLGSGLAAQLQRRLLGSQDVLPADFPPVVHVYVASAGQRRLCLGALADPQAVLTTAQCMLDGAGGVSASLETQVVVGSSESVPGTEGQYVGTDRYLIHPNYTTNGLNHNLAVVYLTDPAPMSTNVSTVAIYNRYMDANTTTLVVGAGQSEANAKQPPTRLQAAPFTVAPANQCAAAQTSSYNNGPTFCAETPGAPNVCTGDSSSPAFVQEDGRWYVAGLVGAKHAEDDSASCDASAATVFFTRLAYYLPWLTADAGLTRNDLAHGTGGEPADPPPGIDPNADEILPDQSASSAPLTVPLIPPLTLAALYGMVLGTLGCALGP
ncbi:hypothetical protein H4R34_000309 [Dimargaris verticillata]|uniref:Peptidase S1 domain-containing protein n=1 Tax=Dimargaris verticillata TaxID=2761393 RepID=A0A9W8B7B2_9FUNG|nr:hypothetical protein H4R34_000309 [Dimargaris verticillata]